MLSQACKYAIRAMFLLAQRKIEGGYVGIKDIAESLGAPQHFIAKILQVLTKKGFLISAKGPNGGFRLSEVQENISLLDIVLAIDGNKITTSCWLGLNDCSEKTPCPVHFEYKVIKKQITAMLSSTKVSDYNDELSISKMFLKNNKGIN
ncbi:MAG: Rrf2 family transcriptional regulator [Bacteroidetes bacterium]|nr:Rrf2 family transcriptional regulator [Bacteroidota bacterium]